MILKGEYLKQQKQYFLIKILNIAFGIIKNHQKLKKNKLCYNEVKNDNNIFIYYKAI